MRSDFFVVEDSNGSMCVNKSDADAVLQELNIDVDFGKMGFEILVPLTLIFYTIYHEALKKNATIINKTEIN